MAQSDEVVKGHTQEEESNAVPEVSMKLVKGVALALQQL